VYWKVVASHEVLVRGIAETEDEACAHAADAKRDAKRKANTSSNDCLG